MDELLPELMISTHTSRVGCDYQRLIFMLQNVQFLLTHPVWDVTIEELKATASIKISTHTSRVGCDEGNAQMLRRDFIFLLTHPVWDVTCWWCCCVHHNKFLLTHPVWDVTEALAVSLEENGNFYSHIPCGMWPKPKEEPKKMIKISTHTSRVGCD